MGQFATQAGTGSALDPAIFFVSGSIAGAAEGFVTYPFEFAKTTVQLRNNFNTNNPLRVISQIIARQGPAALYTGCSTLVIGNMGKDGVRFFAYTSIKERLAGPNGRAGLFEGILAGMCAGITESVLAVTPSERIKTTLIDDAKSGQKSLRGPLDAVRSIVRQGGVASLYKGLAATTIKQGSTSAVRMGSYNFLKETSEKYGVKNSVFTTFITGAMAGTITVYSTQPFDCVKTRSQALGSPGTLGAFKGILSDYGIKGFWRGSTMRLGRLLLGGGVVFTVYEHSLSLIQTVLLPGN
ncbi:mitochondrial carrier domain-containing protein [Penicillium maclennaniae]|uniref:mitochondrial carrier domain-containing protein n=1 Tax=Penicillium maclennaniae TaxID=1343394 RepID=UPI0025415C18|nr:mitochondrial carrier domain-containing protein [Penicillium maclennaniae]KAJ5677873.1 mitochondrial carrier domain-containing protein [Penicillium maclennaniae]